MIVLGIDPGPEKSGAAIVEFLDVARLLKHNNQVPNSDLLQVITNSFEPDFEYIAIEDQNDFGKWYGANSKNTVHWTGRFYQSALDMDFACALMTYSDISGHLCSGINNAPDAMINEAVRLRFADIGGRLKKGTKKKPGPFYGVNGQHVMSAIAVAIAYKEIFIDGNKT